MSNDRLSEERLTTAMIGLGSYLADNGPMHDEDCPGDDTCECSEKYKNDAANDAYHILSEMLCAQQRRAADVAGQGSACQTCAALRHTIEVMHQMSEAEVEAREAAEAALRARDAQEARLRTSLQQIDAWATPKNVRGAPTASMRLFRIRELVQEALTAPPRPAGQTQRDTLADAPIRYRVCLECGHDVRSHTAGQCADCGKQCLVPPPTTEAPGATTTEER